MFIACVFGTVVRFIHPMLALLFVHGCLSKQILEKPFRKLNPEPDKPETPEILYCSSTYVDFQKSIALFTCFRNRLPPPSSPLPLNPSRPHEFRRFCKVAKRLCGSERWPSCHPCLYRSSFAGLGFNGCYSYVYIYVCVCVRVYIRYRQID